MSEMDLPPYLRSLVDQADAANRDVLAEAMTLYREHAAECHDGDPSPCGQSFVSALFLGMMGRPALTRIDSGRLLGYVVEQLYVAEQQLAAFRSTGGAQ